MICVAVCFCFWVCSYMSAWVCVGAHVCVCVCVMTSLSPVLTPHVSGEPIRDPHSLTPHLTPTLMNVCVRVRVYLCVFLDAIKPQMVLFCFFFCLLKVNIPYYWLLFHASLTNLTVSLKPAHLQFLGLLSSIYVCHYVCFWCPRTPKQTRGSGLWLPLDIWPHNPTTPYKSAGQCCVCVFVCLNSV